VAPYAADDQDTEALRSLLAEIDGVARVVIDVAAGVACLVARRGAAHEEIAAAARDIAQGYAVLVTFDPDARVRQRVRFVSLDRQVQPDQQVRYTAVLEWDGRLEAAMATGEKGEGVELRTVATATLAAVTALVPELTTVRLAGVKQVRAFDADLVVVSLYRPESRLHNLVGAVVAAGDSGRAAATAVLSALNRLLGNYLTLGS
jgi:hypothetical protein